MDVSGGTRGGLGTQVLRLGDRDFVLRPLLLLLFIFIIF